MNFPKAYRKVCLTFREAPTEQQIRSPFVKCTKSEAKRLSVPRDLAERPRVDLDFLGWRDPQATDRAYLVTEQALPQDCAGAPSTPPTRPRWRWPRVGSSSRFAVRKPSRSTDSSRLTLPRVPWSRTADSPRRTEGTQLSCAS